MFIYEFMSGIVELMPGGDDDENFDPHEHRKIRKPTTYAETMTHMLKGSIGAGLLAMPDAMRRMGVICGILGIVIIGFFATYCILLLISAQYRLCKRKRRGYLAYHKSMLFAISDGPPCMRWSAMTLCVLVDTMLIVWQVGIGAVYLVFVAVNIKQVTDYHGDEIPLRMIIIYSFPILLLICLVKDLKLLSPISSVSNILTIMGLGLVFFYLIETDIDYDTKKLNPKGFEAVPIFIGITLFALEAVGVVLAIEYNMEKPREFTGLCGLFSIGMVIIISIFVLLGLFGYLKYGDDLKGSITLNLPYNEKKAQAAKITFALALYLSFPLQNYVAYEIIWRKITKRVKTASKNKMRLIDFFLRVLIAVIPRLALAAPSLGAFMGLLGALCLSLVAIVFPAVMDIAINYPTYGFCYYKMLRDLVIVIMGLVAMVSGCYTSVLEMIEAYNLE